MKGFDVIGMSYSAMDYLGIVPRYPEFDTKMELLEFTRQGGGPAATAMVAVARLGGRASYVGRVGDDAFGQFMLAELAREGVHTGSVIIEPGATSQFAFIIVDKESGKRTILWTRGQIPPLLPEDLNPEHIRSCLVLLVDGHDLRAAIAAAGWANEAGIPVVYDAGTVREGSEELVERTDYLATTTSFARKFTGSNNPLEAARRMLGGRRKLSAVTLGENGCVYATPEGVFQRPAFKVDVVDTTGAGDVFHGALAFGVTRGWPLHELVEFACAVAALKCTRLGGRAGIPTLDRAIEFLRQRSDNPFWTKLTADS